MIVGTTRWERELKIFLVTSLWAACLSMDLLRAMSTSLLLYMRDARDVSGQDNRDRSQHKLLQPGFLPLTALSHSKNLPSSHNPLLAPIVGNLPSTIWTGSVPIGLMVPPAICTGSPDAHNSDMTPTLWNLQWQTASEFQLRLRINVFVHIILCLCT